MATETVEFDVIKNGIRKIRDRAEIGIRRITANFLVNNFFEDIEVMKNRGYSFDEILDELNIMLVDVVPDKTERDKMFSIKSGTLKVYMSLRRKELYEASKNKISKKTAHKKNSGKSVSDVTMQKQAETTKNETAPQQSNSGIVPTGRARATDLDREI